MPVIQGKTAIPVGDTSDWVDTDGSSNIIVGVEGDKYAVQYNLGSDIIYSTGGAAHFNEGVLIAKANQVRVKNTSAEIINFEVFD